MYSIEQLVVAAIDSQISKCLPLEGDQQVKNHVKRVLLDYIIKREIAVVTDPSRQMASFLNYHPGRMLVPPVLLPKDFKTGTAFSTVRTRIRDVIKAADSNLNDIINSRSPEMTSLVRYLFDNIEQLVRESIDRMTPNIEQSCVICGCLPQKNRYLEHISSHEHAGRLNMAPWSVAPEILAASFCRNAMAAMILAFTKQKLVQINVEMNPNNPRHRPLRLSLSGFDFNDTRVVMETFVLDMYYGERTYITINIRIPANWGSTNAHMLLSSNLNCQPHSENIIKLTFTPESPQNSSKMQKCVIKIPISAPHYPGRTLHFQEIYISSQLHHIPLLIQPRLFAISVCDKNVGEKWSEMVKESSLTTPAPFHFFRNSDRLKPSRSLGDSNDGDAERAVLRRTTFSLNTLGHWEKKILPFLAQNLPLGKDRICPSPDEVKYIKNIWDQVEDLFPKPDNPKIHPLLLQSDEGKDILPNAELIKTLKYMTPYNLDARMISEILFEIYEQENQNLTENVLEVNQWEIDKTQMTLYLSPFEMTKHRITNTTVIACHDKRRRFSTHVSIISTKHHCLVCSVPKCANELFRPKEADGVLKFFIVPDRSVNLAMMAIWSCYRRPLCKRIFTNGPQAAKNLATDMLRNIADRYLNRNDTLPFWMSQSEIMNVTEKICLFTNGGQHPISENQMAFLSRVSPYIQNNQFAKPPFILQGPPGTGKSHSLSMMLTWTSERDYTIPNTLIATPTNIAAEQLMHKIHCSFKNRTVADSANIIWAVRQNFMNENPEVGSELRPYLRETPDISKFFSAQIVVCTADYLIKHILNRQIFYLNSNYRHHFSLLIFEEGAALTLNQGLLCSLAGERATIIIAGDIYQLPPVLTNHQQLKGGLSQSFMAFIVKNLANPLFRFCLNINYRSLSELLYVSNSILYTDEKRMFSDRIASEGLRSSLLNYDMETLRKFFPMAPEFMASAVLIHDVPRVLPGSRSLANLSEVSVVVRCVQVLRDARVAASDIGVIAMYATQVRLLKEILHSMGCADVFCGNPNSSQGGERDFIIISCVRGTDSSDALVKETPPTYDIGQHGYVSLERTNVAWSRARVGSILIVDPSALLGQPFVSLYLHHVISEASYINLLTPCQLASLCSFLQPPLTNFNGQTSSPYPVEDGCVPLHPHIAMETN